MKDSYRQKLEREAALDEGEDKKEREIVKNMLSEGLSFSSISKYTHIPESDLKAKYSNLIPNE